MAKKNNNSQNQPNGDKPKKKAFEIPKTVIDQLNECTGGAFILFYADEESSPSAHLQCDNLLMRRGLEDFVLKWAVTNDMIFESIVSQSVIGGDEEPEEDKE